MKRVFHVKEDDTIRKSFEDLLDAERTLYSARCPEIVNEMDERPLYGCLYNLLMFPLNLVHGVF